MKRSYFTALLLFFSYTLHLFSQVTLVLPKNNDVSINNTQKFIWNTTENISSEYTLEISTDSSFTNILSTSKTTAGSLIYTFSPSLINGTFYWRVKANRSSIWSNTYRISIINLKNFSSLVGWFSADSGIVHDVSNNISLWKDLSSIGNDASQTNDISKPTFFAQESAINNKPAVKFTSDASEIKTMLFNNSISLNNFTILLVRNHEPSGFAAQYVIAGVDNGILSEINALSSGYGHYRFAEYRFSNSASLDQKFGIYTHQNDLIRKNGVVTPLSYNSVTSSLLLERIGTRTDFLTAAYKGKLAEFFIYGSLLPVDSVVFLENYLRYKYAPPVNLGTDTVFGNSFCDTLRLYAGNRFTNYLWSTGETTPSIKATANNTYSVTVKDIFGFESMDDIVVLPYRKLGNKTVYLCKGDTLKLNLNLPGTFSALWSTGLNNTKININQTGTYTVLITDNKSCQFRDTINVVVHQTTYSPPVVNDNLVLCEGEKLFLQTNIDFDSIYWSTPSSENFTTFPATGSYRVFSRTNTGCVYKDTFNVSISGKAPTADFNFTAACQNAPMFFTDASVIPPGNTTQTRRWTFSNNTTATIPNPINTFSTPGIATASLKITTNVGCTDSIFKTFTVNRNPEPYFYNLLSCEGNATTFVDQSIANAASMTDWRWGFDDLGVINSIQNPSFTFNSPGEYNIKLIATNSNNCSDSVTLPATVYPSPVSNFSFDSVCGRSPLSLRYLATVAPPSTLTAWSWEFGDGTFENAIQNPQKVYNSPGIYTVKLAVRSSNQCVDTAEKQVKVFDFPLVDFDVSQSQCIGKEIQFTDISSTPDGTPINKWKWFFSGQTTSDEQNPRYTFNTQGNYVVQLTATNSVGCTGTKLRSIAVSSLPEPKFIFTPANVMPGESVSYSNQSPPGGSYIWDYGDASPVVNTYNPPVHSYSSLGTYPITLIATDFRGCTDSLTKYILVGKAYLDGVMASINFTPNGDFYKVQVTIVNNSNIEITSLGLSLQLSGGGLVRENWTGSLMPGKSVVYSFTAEIKVDDSSVPVICANIDNINNNAREDKLDNNSTCKETRVGQFDVLNIYPNPAYETVNFGVMLPQDGKVSIRLIDILGKVLYTTDFNGVKGYNNLPVNTGYLNAAVYVAEVYYDGEIIRKKFARKDRR